MLTKVCTRCGEEKLLIDFYRDAGCKDGYIGICKSCRIDQNRAWLKKKKKSKAESKAKLADSEKSIMADYREAQAQGMSYGQYQALRLQSMQEWKKAKESKDKEAHPHEVNLKELPWWERERILENRKREERNECSKKAKAWSGKGEVNERKQHLRGSSKES